MSLALFLTFLGLVFVYLEFFLPGGILALIGCLVLVASVVVFATQGAGWAAAVFYLLALLFVVYGVGKFALSRVRRSGSKDSFYLKRDQEGFFASEFDVSLIGKRGLAFSDLKPSGHVVIEGRHYQAVSERGYLSKDTQIEVVGGKSAHLIVKGL